MSALGFFGGDDSSSSSEDETETVEQTVKVLPEIERDEAGEKDKLPSPSKLLSSIQRPDFLKSADAQARRDLIAEKRAQLEQDRLNSCRTHSSKGLYGAMAPPAELDPSSVVSAKPVRYECNSKSVAEAVTTSTRATEAVKRPHEPEDSGESNSKKKTDFNGQKEKKEGDLDKPLSGRAM